jgi:hypothetical protein
VVRFPEGLRHPLTGKRLVKEYRAPEHAFARRYTPANVALLAEVDGAMNTLSGPATACVLLRQRDALAHWQQLGAAAVDDALLSHKAL